MSLQTYLIGIKPEEYHKLARSKKEKIKLIKSETFPNRNFLKIGNAWYAAYCVLALSFPEKPIMEEPILGGESSTIYIDGNPIGFRYMPYKRVRDVSEELCKISLHQLKTLDEIKNE